MPATRDGKLWRSQFYYKDWQGVRRKKNKRGFKTKGGKKADEWEKKNNLDPNDPADGTKYSLSPEYTNLEVYMNNLVNHLFPTKK